VSIAERRGRVLAVLRQVPAIDILTGRTREGTSSTRVGKRRSIPASIAEPSVRVSRLSRLVPATGIRKEPTRGSTPRRCRFQKRYLPMRLRELPVFWSSRKNGVLFLVALLSCVLAKADDTRQKRRDERKGRCEATPSGDYSMKKQMIKLTDILPIGDPSEYKLHLACANEEGVRPLNEYVIDRNKWIGWNEWRGDKDQWTRKYIFSFIEFYPISNAYLFGGVFEVKERHSDRYVIEEVPKFAKWEGRLVCKFHRYQGLRGRAFYLETLLDSFEVLQVLPDRYEGEQFCGYENINHSFAVLRSIVRREKQDWKVSLAAVKGVYLIVDTNNGKTYVGSAYGEAGIWSRLHCYVDTGHGWNDELVKTIGEKGIDYALNNFKFSILEIFTFNTSDDVILNRESHWKNVMLSRQFGYNRN